MKINEILIDRSYLEGGPLPYSPLLRQELDEIIGLKWSSPWLRGRFRAGLEPMVKMVSGTNEYKDDAHRRSCELTMLGLIDSLKSSPIYDILPIMTDLDREHKSIGGGWVPNTFITSRVKHINEGLYGHIVSGQEHLKEQQDQKSYPDEIKVRP